MVVFVCVIWFLVSKRVGLLVAYVLFFVVVSAGVVCVRVGVLCPCLFGCCLYAF